MNEHEKPLLEFAKIRDKKAILPEELLNTAQSFIFKKERDEELKRITNIIKERKERDKFKHYQN